MVYEIENMYPCVIAVITYGYEFGANELNYECAITRTINYILLPR